MSTHTIETGMDAAGFKPEPLSSRIFVRCYRHYGDAKRAYHQLQVVARIPDKRMTVVARGLEWREPLPTGRLYKLSCGLAAVTGAAVGFVLWLLGLAARDVDWITQILFGACAGAALSFVVATAVGWLRRDRTGLAETGHVEPRQYDMLVEEEYAPAARTAGRGLSRTRQVVRVSIAMRIVPTTMCIATSTIAPPVPTADPIGPASDNKSNNEPVAIQAFCG
jgi:hypothetical protein